jgi:protein tyrosine phosphatase
MEAVERFIEIANDRRRRPMLVHCKAGIGRTGSMVGRCRLNSVDPGAHRDWFQGLKLEFV